jgi:cytochrome c oxidase subunit 2
MARRLPGMLPDGYRSGRLPRLAAVLGLLLMTVVFASCGVADDPQSTIAQGGEANERIWFVYNILWVLSAIVFVLVEGMLIYAIWRFRHRPRMAHGRPVPVHGNTRLEIIWTIIPAIIIAGIGIPTLQVLAELSDSPDEDSNVAIEAIAHQFFFEFRYPEGVNSSNVLHIPEDTYIDVSLHSNDVIHSFWVPKLNGKTDMIPGRVNEMWLRADDPGTYAGQCAEFCGVGHALMKFQVEVHTQEDYEAWIQEQLNPSTAEGDPATGEQLVVNGACAACHAIEGTSAQGAVGPALDGIASRPQIAGVVENNEENLRAWISNAPALKPGTAMPPMNLSEADLNHVVAYLQTLTE